MFYHQSELSDQIYSFGRRYPFVSGHLPGRVSFSKKPYESVFELQLTIHRIAEICAGIVCSCMPLLPSLLHKKQKPRSWWKNSQVGNISKHDKFVHRQQRRWSRMVDQITPPEASSAEFQWLRQEDQRDEREDEVMA